MIPKCLLTCRTLDEFWGFIQSKLERYHERREYLRQEFDVLLTELEGQCFSNLDLITPIKDKFNSLYISAQIDEMLKLQETNPTDAFGKSKELVESCCL